MSENTCLPEMQLAEAFGEGELSNQHVPLEFEFEISVPLGRSCGRIGAEKKTRNTEVKMTDDNLSAENFEFHLVTILEKLEVLRREKISENGQKKPPMRVELRTFEFWKALISESIASFVYTFLVCGANAASRMGNTSAANVFLFTAITSGFVMMFLTQFFAHVSGKSIVQRFPFERNFLFSFFQLLLIVLKRLIFEV